MAKTRSTQEERRYGDAGKRADQSGSDRPSLNMPEGIQLWKPSAKPYTVDFLPYKVSKKILKFGSKNFAEPGQWYYERTYWMHYSIGAAEEAVVCPAKTFGQKCPVCEHAAELRQDTKTTKDQLKPFFWKERQLFLVFVHEEQDKGVQLWEVAYHNFGKQLDAKLKNADPSKKAAYLRFFIPTIEGFTLRIVGDEETTGSHKYAKFRVDEFLKRKAPLKDSLVNHGVCLDEIPVVLDYDELYKKFKMLSDEEEEQEAGTTDETEAEEVEETEAEETEEEEKTEEEEEEVEETETSEIEVGDEVTFEYKNKTKQGVVKQINTKKALAKVEVEGQEKESIVALSDLSKVTEEEEQEEEEETEDDGWGETEEAEETEEEEAFEEEKPQPKKKVKPKKK